MRAFTQFAKSITPVRRLALRYKMRGGVGGQSDEGQILQNLVRQESAPKTFVEFGFHVSEFNCSALLPDFNGLLIDGSQTQVDDARHFLPSTVRAEQRFLTLENLDIVRNAFEKVGVLSIDVDGNDYWFLEALVDLGPSVVCVEYNSSFGSNSVTVPYDPAFDRSKKHNTGWYHGASLNALSRLAERHGYGLAAISKAGGNAFFTRSGTLSPADEWKPIALREHWSGKTTDQQWEQIRHLPYQTV